MAPRLSLLALVGTLFLTACGGVNPAASTPAPAPTAAPARPADAAKPAATGAPAAAPADRAASAAGAPQASAPAAGAPGPGAPRAAQAPVPPPTPVSKPSEPKPGDGSNPSQTPDLPAATIPNRMIIYNTQLTLLVRSVDAAVRAVGDIATLNGGYVAGVENGSENGLPVSTIKLKVLPDRYQAAMNALRDGGLAVEVRDEKATTQDVTEEYSDVQTQLASLEASYRQLLDLLSRATTMDEILKIQNQAAQVKLQIDRLKGRATALERLSELATITVKLQAAEAVLGKDYVAVRSQLRGAQQQYATQSLALKRARTPEEEAKIRDALAELQLQIDRSTARLKEIEQKAGQANVALPTVAADDATQPKTAVDLPQQYIDARVALRRAEARQAEITRRLKLSLPAEEADALRAELSAKILELSSLNGQLKTLQDRANQLGVTLPTLTPEQEAALAGTTVDANQPDPGRSVVTAWEASLAFLRGALAGLLGGVVFFWWAIPLLALAAVVARNRLAARGWPARRAGAAPAAPVAPDPAPPAA